MSVLVVAGSIVSSLIVNECCELSPWLARKVVRWSAAVRYTDPGRAEKRGEELAALIDSRPGQLFKLITALGFALAAIRSRVARYVDGIIAADHLEPAVPGKAGTMTIVTTMAAALCLAASLTATWAAENLGTHGRAEPAAVHMTSPGIDDVVNRMVDVQGDVSHLPPGYSLWFSVQDMSDLRIDPNAQPCSVAGPHFNCGDEFLGSPNQHNLRFRLEMWIVGSAQISQINAYNIKAPMLHYPGMTTPPAGTTIAAFIQVLRL